MKPNFENLDKIEHKSDQNVLGNEQGAIGYIIAWLLGVPAVVLFVIFVLRGFD